MDVMDAGVYVSKWEAFVPKHAQMTLWGPLQAREMGFDGWEVQDGGETGFVTHNGGVHLTMGRATSTLIFVRRLERAYLTIYFGGYPSDAPQGQRKLDLQKVVGACELFLGRLAKQPVQFEMKGEMTLVDNRPDARVLDASASTGRLLGGGRKTAGAIIDADEEVARKAGYVPAAGTKGKVIDGDAKATKVAGKKGDVWEV
ncbi:MAG TPA: hypothetical protein VM241_08455 [Candidatus Thermoplasmatota archaeon]|nr:hypothetical protein [Candidatus Thermoplasmatota archaeon]